jgi:adenylate cyclase
MLGGTGRESRRVLIAVMLAVLVVNAFASLLGQTYADLIRPAGSREWSPSALAITVGVASSLVVLLLLTTSSARHVVGSRVSVRHVVSVAVVFFVVGGMESAINPASDFAHRSRLETLAVDLPGALIWMLAISPLVWRRATDVLLPGLRWLDEHRRPTPEERTALVRLPAAAALFALPYWLMLATYNLVTNFWCPLGVGAAFATFFGILMTRLATAALIYLLAERRLRPLFAEAFRGSALPKLATAGIRARLLVAWGLGSGIPLLFVMLSPGALNSTKVLDKPQVVAPTFVFLGVVGLAAGFLTMRAAARSLAEPMEEVRRGLEQVRQGNIAVELAIDDAGEVGSVKVGFNEMVAGLRERAMLEDLFGRHVGADVARRALEEGTALGGEQREVTVFFVDLVGSTGLAETCTPSEVVATLNGFFASVVAAVSAESGWVDKFEGDGALCVFGTPADQPDHAARALRAVHALHESLVSVADAAIGIASGDVVAGNVGAEERYEYTVIGRPVNTAARLTDEAKRRPGRVLATEEAVAAAGAAGERWVAIGEVNLRGIPKPVVAFEPAPVAVS